MANKSLDELLKTLPEHAPKRDLWQGIEASIVSEQVTTNLTDQNSSFRWAAVAASVLCVGLLSYYGQYMTRTIQDQTALEIMAQLSDSHQTQKQALLVSYQDTPVVVDDWQTQLDELESAAEAIKTALKADPDNTALLRMLQQIYQQQIDLIESVHAKRWQRV
jgi:cytochrome c-type biogenesis protein CcmH/NrfG